MGVDPRGSHGRHTGLAALPLANLAAPVALMVLLAVGLGVATR